MLKKLMKMRQCLLELALNSFSKIKIKYGKKVRLLKTDFESKPVHGDDDKYIKTKINVYGGSAIINFHNKKCQRESSM